MRISCGIKLFVLAMLCLAGVSGCGKHVKPKSMQLDSNTRVTLRDAWVLDHAPQLLQAVFVYEGADPNNTYHLHAELRETKDGEDRRGSWIKQYATAGKSTNQMDVIWEFMSFPKKSTNIYLRFYYADKESGRRSGQLEFVLPGVPDLPVRKMGSQ